MVQPQIEERLSITPEAKEQAAAVKETLRFLGKMLKMSNLFGRDHSNVQVTRGEFKKSISALLGTYGKLSLELDGDKIVYKGVVVSEQAGARGSSENFASKLFMAGIIEIVLLPGLDDHEIDSMLQIFVANYTTGPFCHDDPVSLFWELNPQFFKLNVAPELVDAGGGDSKGAESTEDCLNVRMELQKRQSGLNPNYDATTSREQPVNIEQLNQAMTGGKYFLTPEELETVHKMVETDSPQLIVKYFEVILPVIAYDNDEKRVTRAREVLKKLFFGMSEGAGTKEACDLLERLRSIGNQKDTTREVMVAVSKLLSDFSSGELVGKIIRGMIPAGTGAQPDDEQVNFALKLLALLGKSAIPHILTNFDSMPFAKVRTKMAMLLARQGKNNVEQYKNYIFEKGAVCKVLNNKLW